MMGPRAAEGKWAGPARTADPARPGEPVVRIRRNPAAASGGARFIPSIPIIP